MAEKCPQVKLFNGIHFDYLRKHISGLRYNTYYA